MLLAHYVVLHCGSADPQALPWSLLRFAFLGLVGVVSHKVSCVLPGLHAAVLGSMDLTVAVCCSATCHQATALVNLCLLGALQLSLVLHLWFQLMLAFLIIGSEHKAQYPLGCHKAHAGACCYLHAIGVVQQRIGAGFYSCGLGASHYGSVLLHQL